MVYMHVHVYISKREMCVCLRVRGGREYAVIHRCGGGGDKLGKNDAVLDGSWIKKRPSS